MIQTQRQRENAAWLAKNFHEYFNNPETSKLRRNSIGEYERQKTNTLRPSESVVTSSLSDYEGRPIQKAQIIIRSK